jgi:CubicO group peptidase (beta-lactamase class C family)
MTASTVSSSAPSDNETVAIDVAPERVGFDPERLARLDEALQQHVASRTHSGISVVVSRHGQVVHSRDFGVQTLGSDEPLRSDGIFRIASMTKPITGVAMLMLYERGLWQLDDPVAKHLPELDELMVLDPSGRLVPPRHPMTMRELVTSTGGISGNGGVAGSFRNGPGVEVKRLYEEAVALFAAGEPRVRTLADLVGVIASLPLASHPGEQFQYGYSQDVQGRVVEVLSGQRFDDFLREHLFRPLGMVDTDFWVRPGQEHRLVQLPAYDEHLDLVPSPLQGLMVAPTGDPTERPSLLSGGGGLVSTIADYVRFAHMLRGRGALDGVRILAPSTVRLMASDLLPEGVPIELRKQWTGQGYGVNVGVVLDPGRATLSNGGIGHGTFHWSGAHGTWFWVDPDNDVVVVGMTQLEFGGIPHMGAEHPAPDLRALTASLVYAALVAP